MRLLTAAIVATGIAALAAPVDAADKKPVAKQPTVSADGGHPASAYYRRAPEVRGFVQRRGGYSYSLSDITNTYGDSRVTYGAHNSYRDPSLDRQSRNGPFDHGFFFDSGIAPRGGSSPYPN